MRILFVLAYYHPYIGGAEYVFKRLAEGLSLHGHSVKVITTHLPGTPYTEVVNGVDVERVPVPRFFDRCFFSVFSLPNIVRQVGEYDLIHTASNNIAIPASLVSRISGKPVAFTCHEVLDKRWNLVESPRLKAWVYRGIEKMVIKNPYDRYVAVSFATYQDLLQEGIDPGQITVVYNGVDEIFSANIPGDGSLRSMVGLKPDDFLYLYYGRVGVTKGVDFLVKAVPLIQKKIPNAHLALILSKEPYKQYEKLCRTIGEMEPGFNIHLVPRAQDRRQLVRYLRDADCIVIPSLTEGFGLTTAEACALEVPVVASRVGSIPEVISGRHVLVEPGSPEALCEGLVRAWQGKYDEWKPLKQFSWTKMVTGYEEVYTKLLSNRMGAAETMKPQKQHSRVR